MLGNKAADATGNEEKEEEKEEEEGVEIGNFRINILLVIPVEETRDVKRIRKKSELRCTERRRRDKKFRREEG